MAVGEATESLRMVLVDQFPAFSTEMTLRAASNLGNMVGAVFAALFARQTGARALSGARSQLHGRPMFSRPQRPGIRDFDICDPGK